jgi:hypothetical protein
MSARLNTGKMAEEEDLENVDGREGLNLRAGRYGKEGWKSDVGTSLPSHDVRYSVAIGGKADIRRTGLKRRA